MSQLQGTQAVLFDLDGVLVQTESLKAKAHAATARHFGGDVSADVYPPVMGQSRERVRNAFLSAGGITVEPERYDQVYEQKYGELLRTKLQATPGVEKVLSTLKDQQIQLAVVSSSVSTTMEQILKWTGLDHFFSARVAADDVKHKKPAPDPYRVALERLPIPPTAAVAVEDSESGVESAASAGLQVLAFHHSFNLGHCFSRASVVLDSFLDTDAVVQVIKSLLDPGAGERRESGSCRQPS